VVCAAAGEEQTDTINDHDSSHLAHPV